MELLKISKVESGPLIPAAVVFVCAEIFKFDARGERFDDRDTQVYLKLCELEFIEGCKAPRGQRSQRAALVTRRSACGFLGIFRIFTKPVPKKSVAIGFIHDALGPLLSAIDRSNQTFGACVTSP